MGGCLRAFIRTPVSPGDPHSTIWAFNASPIVDKSYSCHRRRLCLLARLACQNAATIICLRSSSQVTAVTNCGLGMIKPCGWSCPACPLPSSELSVSPGAAHGSVVSGSTDPKKPAGYCLTRTVKGPPDPSSYTHVR